MAKTIDEKVNTVLSQNTFWFNNKLFEEEYEGHITSLRETLLVLRNQIQNHGLTRQLLEDLLIENENGLKALLALTGFSNETFKRLITFIRIIDDKILTKLTNRDLWLDETELDKPKISDWSDNYIQKMIHENVHFRKGIVNLFYKGSTIPILSRTLPLFELKKLSLSKISFEVEAMIDTLIRYKEKGSYSARTLNNPEMVIKNLLDDINVDFESGDLEKLKELSQTGKRTMDFIIPSQENPQVIIESSYLTTTSSGQGDKAKTEVNVRQLIVKHYPNARFWGFIDGIGWYVRKRDLKRMVEAYEEVFTFNFEELERFKELLITVLK